MINIEEYTTKLKAVCDSSPVKRLGLFGSALTDHFSEQSDIDILVVFDRERNSDPFSAHFDLKEKLETIFNRTVDLVVDKPFSNPYFQKVVDRTRLVLYEQ